jgi:hypothetical protein
MLVALAIVLPAAGEPLAAKTVIVALLHDAAPEADADAVEGVTDLVAGVLADRVTVMSGEKLQAALKEQGLSVRGLVDEKAAAGAGKLLKADYVLTGSLFRRDDRVEFVVQIVDVRTGAVKQGITASGPADRLLDVANDLASQCAKALAIETPMPEGEAVDARRLAQERDFLEALGCYHAGDYDRACMNCL